MSILFQIIESLKDDGCQVVISLKQIVLESKRYLSHDIGFVYSNYGFLPDTIRKLESGKLPLADTLRIFDDAVHRINMVGCDIGQIVQKKLKASLEANPDYSTVRKINAILTRNDEYLSSQELPPNLKLADLDYYKWCLLVSVDAERCFSRYKAMLRDNRRSFIFDNLSKYFFLNCNSNL